MNASDHRLALVALDIGTTNVKGEARLYLNGNCIQRNTPSSVSLGFSGGLVRAEHFREATEEVLREVFRGLDPEFLTLAPPRLAISQLGEAFFALDAQGRVVDGYLHTSQSPLGPGVMRSPEPLDLEALRDLTARHSGIRADEEITSIMLLELLRSRPELHDDMTLVCSAGAYLIWSLTGQRATTMSVLGRAGLANMETWDISYPVLEMLGFNPLWFPRVALSGHPVARILPSQAQRLGLPPNVRFYPQIHDQCAAYEGAVALTQLPFGMRTILTGTANGICAPSQGKLDEEIVRAIADEGYCFYPGLRPRDRFTLLYHLDGEPEESLMQRLAGNRSKAEAYEELDRRVFESYIERKDPIQATYIPSRRMSFPVHRFPEGRDFEGSFKMLSSVTDTLSDAAKLRDSMAGKILFIRAAYEAHCRLLGETPQNRFVAYGGGHSKSIVEFQMYADVLDKEIRVIRGETGLKGCLLTMLNEEERERILPSMRAETEIRVYQPNPVRVEEFNRVYPRFLTHLGEWYPHVRRWFPNG